MVKKTTNERERENERMRDTRKDKKKRQSKPHERRESCWHHICWLLRFSML